MKFIVFLCAALFLSTSSFAQKDGPTPEDYNKRFRRENSLNKSFESSTIQAAGSELVAFKRSYYTGALVQIAGAVLLAAGIANNNSASGATSPLVYVGGACIGIGTTITLFSHRHIGIAGHILQNAN